MRITNFDALVLSHLSPIRWKTEAEVLREVLEAYSKKSLGEQWADILTVYWPEFMRQLIRYRLNFTAGHSLSKLERFGFVRWRPNQKAYDENVFLAEYILTGKGREALDMREPRHEDDEGLRPIPA